MERWASRPGSVAGVPFLRRVARADSSATMALVNSVLFWARKKANSVGLLEALDLASAMTDFSSVCQPSCSHRYKALSLSRGKVSSKVGVRRRSTLSLPCTTRTFFSTSANRALNRSARCCSMRWGEALSSASWARNSSYQALDSTVCRRYSRPLGPVSDMTRRSSFCSLCSSSGNCLRKSLDPLAKSVTNRSASTSSVAFRPMSSAASAGSLLMR